MRCLQLGIAMILIGALEGTPYAASGRASVDGATQAVDREQALGTWRSTEQFDGEPRLTFAFRRQGDEIVGWAVLLGQHRKNDDRATLGLTFRGCRWEGNHFVFETMMPEDEGTIGWELRPTSPNQATLRAVTEDGHPIADDMAWSMAR